MIKLQGKLPRNLFVACSGGIDSMAALDFLRRNHEVTVCYFDHGTDHSRRAFDFMVEYTAQQGLPLMHSKILRDKSKDESWEEFWRNQRYQFLHKLRGPVVTAHHLDDCVETWVMSSMHGTGKWIPYRRDNVVRPFRLNRKRELELWANLKCVPHIEDDSNRDTCYTRNYVRHEMMPHVLRVNPGIHKTIRKKVINDVES
jgi:tRNA(Ile)-lysidine synthase